jgi:hypothetical protein
MKRFFKVLYVGLIDLLTYDRIKPQMISIRAIEIANKIGWDKIMEKAKEAQKNGTSTINLKEYE